MANTVLGRGRVHFDRFTSGYGSGTGFRYIGNTPAFGLAIETQDLDHFNADQGIRIKDESITLEVNYSGTMTCDDIQPDNLALFFFGSHNTITQTAETGLTHTVTVRQGLSYQIGQTPTNPVGDRGVSAVTIPTATEGTDFTVDPDNGRVRITEGGAIADDTEITITYNREARTRSRVISGDTPVSGAIWFESLNPVGQKRDFVLPKTVVRPSGEYQLKGDEWQQMSFAVEILAPEGMAAIYADGEPYVG